MRGISYDDHSGNHITTPQLGVAMGEMVKARGGKPIELFGMDACLMQMYEVAYQVRDFVNVQIGSEQTEPAAGWYYTTFLKELVANPNMSEEELGVIVEKGYMASYTNGPQGNQGVQGSAISLAKMKAAMPQFNAYVDYLLSIAPKYMSQIKAAYNSSQSYAYSDYKDIQHFMKLTLASINDAGYQTITKQTIASRCV